MRSTKISLKAAILFASLALLLTQSLQAYSGVFSNLVAFGDSLSDNGNLYSLLGGVYPDNRDYFEGRFSNGPVWVEYLGMNLGVELDDFAFGGASTGTGLFPPGLNRQIAAWLAQGNSAQGLFTVWAGANDYLFPHLKPTDAERSVENIVDGLETLTGSGATQILMLNLPDLGLTPELLSETAEVRAEASAYSADFNQRMAESLVSFSGDHPGVIIYSLDVYGLFGELVTDPEPFGFQNATEVSPNFGVDFQNEGGYVFWDGVHPTTEAHALLAGEAAALLSKDCADVNDDLSMNLFLVEYGGMRFGFNLNYIGGIVGDPDGFYWEMDLATLRIDSDNILGIDHVVAGDELGLSVPCAEYGGKQYAFELDFVGGGETGTPLWKLNVLSLTVK